MNTIHFTVSGLAGSQSRTKVLNALDKLQGVQEVAVDLKRGTIEVEYNAPATPAQIRQCIEHTGYDVVQ